MNISKIPSERLYRGTIYSMMEVSKPVIETFICDYETITVAFINGLPVPFYALVYALTRVSVERRRVYRKPLTGLSEPNALDGLVPFWQSITLPETRRNSTIPIFITLVKDMVEELTRPEDENDKAFDRITAFKEFIKVIEYDYATSLENAETV